MPARTNAFQRLVTLLSAALAGHAKVTESAMLQDRITGQEREVDVLIVVTTASYQLSLAVEVISWSRFADTPWVEKMRAKHENLPTDKLILVSQKGFSAPAKRKADFYGIECLTIEEACAADWPMIATLGATGEFEVVSLNFDVWAMCKFDSELLELVGIPIDASFSTPSGPKTIESFVRSLLDKPDVQDVVRANLDGSLEHEFWLRYTEADCLWRLDQNGRSGQIMELRIGLKVERRTTAVDLHSGKFRSTPFISGTSNDPLSRLQFVLVKNSDGTLSGHLLDK